MDKNERIYSKSKVHGASASNLNSIFISVDSNAWSGNRVLSLQELSDLLSKNYNSGLGNVVNVCPDVSSAPEGLELIQTYIAVGENYLYVWTGSKWKKVPMIEL